MVERNNGIVEVIGSTPLRSIFPLPLSVLLAFKEFQLYNDTQRILPMPFFDTISSIPDDPIFSLPLLYAKDPRPNKVNLGIGVYLDEDGNPIVLNSVRKAEARIFERQLNKNYLPIDGDNDYIRATLKLIFGELHPIISEKKVFAAATVGGAGALRLGAEFLRTLVGQRIHLSDPTWINHKNIFSRSGMEVSTYPYFDYHSCRLNFPALTEAIQKMPKGSIILLQGCGHNPTGVDPSTSQWQKLSQLIKAQGIIPFFDLAYQGFGKGLDEDAAAIRLFGNDGHEMLVAYSYSKNMGLYGERVGALAIVSKDCTSSQNIASQVRQIIRSVYSTPPLHGERIAATILLDIELKEQWLMELQVMRESLQKRRSLFVDSLNAASDNKYTFLSEQQGMFSFCGLSPQHAQMLIDKYAIYLPMDGRINVAGLSAKNIPYVTESLLQTIRS